MGNPLIDQGTLNRLRGSIVIPAFPEFNITAPFLGKAGIRLALEGESTIYLPTLTGAVRSQEPYMMVSVQANLLKTQSLSDLYKKKMESDAGLEGITVRPDARQLSPYDFLNCSINAVEPMPFNGEDAGYVITIKGYYPINNSLWGQS